jgi:uncharacterized protein involved in exopolysaccharide biosynthesis
MVKLDVEDRLPQTARRVSRALQARRRGSPSRKEVDRLKARVAELEDEIRECRRLNRRVAELTDIVQELLVPLAQRDEDKVREYLDRYAAAL